MLEGWTEREELLLNLVAVNAYAAYTACLVGSPAPKVKQMASAMRDLRPGDMVLEITAGRWRDPENGLGRLLRIAREPLREPEVELGELEPPMGQVFYIETLDGREYRWHNASFIRVLASWEDLREATQ